MNSINSFLVTVDGFLGGSAWFPFLLIGTGLFFTLYLKFPQIRYFTHALRIVTGRYEKKDYPGDTTHFQSLATALSGTVGTGNIGGVGLAIYIGGPAALFWMWVTAFLGMTTKFVECTLSHKYRDIHTDGSVSGGPMYYMSRKLKLPWLAALFAFATIISSFGTGNMPQINNIATSVQASFGLAPLWTASVLTILLALVILGGIRRIARVTEKIVPFMALFYFFGAMAVILTNYTNIIPSFVSIFSDLFKGSAATGGFLGAGFAFAFNRGVNRGIYSNEAGQGSAAIAHSAAQANEPVSEGMVSILEPFIDTLVICTLTGLTILSSGVWTQKVPNTFQQADMMVLEGALTEKAHAPQLYRTLAGESAGLRKFSGTLTIHNGFWQPPTPLTLIHARSIAEDFRFYELDRPYSGNLKVAAGQILTTGITVKGSSLVHSAVLTTEAFTRSFLGHWGQYIVSIGLMLFAFSTVISWSYYGSRAVTYLWGAHRVFPYQILYLIGFFAAALIDTTLVWNLAAVAIVLMAVPNLLGILLLHRDMKQSVNEYWTQFRSEHPEVFNRLRFRS